MALSGILPGWGTIVSALLWCLDGAIGVYAGWIGWELFNHPNNGVTINIDWWYDVWIGHE
ncbi:hypothetical protein ABIA32_003306 [Streptacidiphilus sp. MAP12-20]|uniref:hypothetical protein n=1 Tax=Streptacidiphilus sp. MAP12-20 TaxID=3156299 RepID=UPI0035110834